MQEITHKKFWQYSGDIPARGMSGKMQFETVRFTHRHSSGGFFLFKQTNDKLLLFSSFFPCLILLKCLLELFCGIVDVLVSVSIGLYYFLCHIFCHTLSHMGNIKTFITHELYILSDYE